MRLNGHLVLNADGTSEIKNLFVERLSSNPAHSSDYEGRLIYNTTDNKVYYNDGTSWKDIRDLTLEDLSDISITSPESKQTLIYDDVAEEWVNKSLYFLYESSSADDTHVIVHNLGQKYCNVTVVDDTDNVIIPQSIVYNSDTQLTIAFGVAIDCKAIIMGIE